MDGKYINENAYQKGKKFYKTLAILAAVLGVILIAVGIVLLIESSKFDDISQGTGMSIGGFAMTAFGVCMVIISIVTFVYAHRREIMAYEVSTVAPIVKETTEFVANDIVPSVNKAVGGFTEAVAGGISTGIAKGKNSSKKLKCPKCGELNEPNSKFCGNCGVKFVFAKHCSQCGEELKSTDKFCANCGQKIE